MLFHRHDTVLCLAECPADPPPQEHTSQHAPGTVRRGDLVPLPGKIAPARRGDPGRVLERVGFNDELVGEKLVDVRRVTLQGARNPP